MGNLLFVNDLFINNAVNMSFYFLFSTNLRTKRTTTASVSGIFCLPLNRILPAREQKIVPVS
jgi:hypothetical protein